MSSARLCIAPLLGIACALLCLGVPPDCVASAWSERPDTAHVMHPHVGDRRTLGVDGPRASVARQHADLPPMLSPRRWSESSTTGREASGPAMLQEFWGANGNVLDMARSGNTLYIAGSFRSVGENSGGCVPFSGRTGAPLRPFPKFAGTVHVIVPDGGGGWYVGGEFTAVDGKPRACLAQVLPDGSISSWNPRATGSPGYIDPPAVTAIVVQGDRVFVGGAFREVGGVARENLGCVDARTGALFEWNPGTHVDGFVNALAVDDSTVFIGGYFDSLGGEPRSRLGAVDARTGAVRPWRPEPTGGVRALLLRGDTLFVGGAFGQISGAYRPMLAAVDAQTADLLPFDAHATGVYGQYFPRPSVGALVLAGDTLFAVGSFTQIGGRSQPCIAALDPATGAHLSWRPDLPGPLFEGGPPPPCNAIAIRGDIVYIGGFFQSVGDSSRPFVAGWDRRTGSMTTWNPKPVSVVYALAASGDTVLVGGQFGFFGEWRHRAGLAAIDLATGALKPWNPNPDGIICTAMAARDDRVFVSGDFANIGGQPQPRAQLAALDTLNGDVLPWNPGADYVASALVLAGDTLYAGGYFTQVGGHVRNSVAAIDASTGAVLPWNPDARWGVLDLVLCDNTMYLGGPFQMVGGQWRRGLAAVDAATGELLPWNPDVENGFVESVLIAGGTLYAGGGFDGVGGRSRRSLAAVDRFTGTVTDWDPAPAQWDLIVPNIKALALRDSVLYAGGTFSSVGGQPRICFAAVDTATGLATDWDPMADGYVWSLLSDGDRLYVGGGFGRMGGFPAAGLAGFMFPAPASPPPQSLILAPCAPNPARSTTAVRFALPHAASVTLSIFDLQGRRKTAVFDGASLSAGVHDVAVRVEGWKPGIYLCQLVSEGRTATRKLVVVP